MHGVLSATRAGELLGLPALRCYGSVAQIRSLDVDRLEPNQLGEDGATRVGAAAGARHALHGRDVAAAAPNDPGAQLELLQA